MTLPRGIVFYEGVEMRWRIRSLLSKWERKRVTVSKVNPKLSSAVKIEREREREREKGREKRVENDEIPSRQVSSLEYLVVMDFGARREISREMRSDGIVS